MGGALQAASSRGHRSIIGLLMDHGADVNAQGDNGSALQAVAPEGRNEVTRCCSTKGRMRTQGPETMETRSRRHRSVGTIPSSDCCLNTAQRSMHSEDTLGMRSRRRRSRGMCSRSFSLRAEGGC